MTSKVEHDSFSVVRIRIVWTKKKKNFSKSGISEFCDLAQATIGQRLFITVCNQLTPCVLQLTYRNNNKSLRPYTHKLYKEVHNITKLISFPAQVKVISVYNLQKITIQVTETRGYWRFDLNALLQLNLYGQ